MKIRPLQDRVLVKRLEENTKTAGGIIIPDTAKEKPSEGIVEAVGPGMVSPEGKVIPMRLKSATRFCSENGRVRKLKSTAKSAC